tara:strand:+ start:2333 stop:6994 length:4662 start_codon:yes stop_codon:yes gene_type:complete
MSATNYTQFAYECSRQNASINYGDDYSEWENEFKEGIELKKGDQVRLLGSFVHQGSDSTEIEIENNMELNISYSPFLVADTLDTLDSTAEGTLQDLSDLGDIAYATDSFGIEPPARNTTQNGETDTLTGDFNKFNQCSFVGGAERTYPKEDATIPETTKDDIKTEEFIEKAYSDPATTGERGGDKYGIVNNYWSINTSEVSPINETVRNIMVGDSATTFGMNIKTDQLFTDNNKTHLDYSNFSSGKANCEMYIGNMVKKLILPVFDRFYNFNNTANPKGDNTSTFRTLDDLVLDPPTSGVGMLNGCPKVGMCIATANVAQSAGWFDVNGNGYWENNWDDEAGLKSDYDGDVTGVGPYVYTGNSGYTGVPNLVGGVESVIGTIVATRPILHNIHGRSTPCWEIMVTDFINPASLSDKPIINTFSNANNLTNAQDFTSLQVSTAKTCYKRIHGSGETETNSNFNPSINNINGAYGQMTQAKTYPENLTGLKAGIMSSTPTRNNYLLNEPPNGPNYRIQIEQGGDTANASFTQIGMGESQGLSFLWNGSHTGYMRYNPTISNVDRYRANHLLYWERVNGTDNLLGAHSKINDMRLIENPGVPDESFYRTSDLMGQGSVPVAFGAYIICKKETMLEIATGRYTNVADYWVANATNQPRIWFDYSFQQTDSHYKVRHYKGNSYDTTNTIVGGAVPAGADNIFPDGGTYGPTRITPFSPDKRFGYSMCGRPLNINYRNSTGENGNANRAIAQSLDDNFTLSGNSGQNQNTHEAVGDYMPRYFNTPDGIGLGLAPTAGRSKRGLPGVWGGYNTTCNSIYFQQKETGDTKLGSTSLRANGFCNLTTDIAINPRTIDITKATLTREDTGAVYTPIGGNFIRIVGVNDCQYHNTNVIDTITDNGLFWTITIPATARFYANIPLNSAVIISNGPSYIGSAVGLNGQPWAGDHIMIKEQLIKLQVDNGFYTEEQLAERINDQLHYWSQEYKSKYGTKNADGTWSLTTTVGNKEQALTSQPSILTGNFVNSYIPDINYGFTPVTSTNSVELGLTASTKDITNDLLTYEPLSLPITYYWSELLPNVSNVTTNIRKLNDHSDAFPTILGKHFKLYTIPIQDQETPQLYKEIHLIRLRGGSLNTQLDFVTTDGGTTKSWQNKRTRFVGSYEMLRDYTMSSILDTFPEKNSTTSFYSYRTRFTRNLFPSGGSARCYVGANNFTFSWEEGANRYSLNNLYTPVRPHKPPSTGTDQKNDFGIGDAIPSALINSRPNGTILSQLSGIYINNLNGDLFTRENWGVATIGNAYTYDIINSEELQLLNTTFLNIIGYTLEQLTLFNNSFNQVTDLFLYRDYLTQSGSAIRVGAKMTTAINSSNPLASKCLLIAPVTQFMVQVETDDFFAQNSPLKGNDPYFFIGTTFPFTQFHGNDNGSKLPIMGICARNFQAFGFSFDLGGSAVSFLIEADTRLTSIRTKIYTSNLQTPSNLSPYSSVIYLITRYNYLKDLTPEQAQFQIEQTMAQQNAGIANAYNNPALNSIRTSLPSYKPDKYYFTGRGSQEVVQDDEDSDDY